MAKITKATIKSFIRKNKDKIYIKVRSKFDGMYDCCMEVNNGFHKATASDRNEQYTLGIEGAWFVGQSRDYFNSFDNDDFTGYEIFNSCGAFYLAIRKEAA